MIRIRQPNSWRHGYQEERRLMYVGITRAQRTLHISWCKNASGDAKSCQCEPSRFIEEMKLDEGDAPPKEDEIINP